MSISLKAKKAVTKPLTITIDGEPLKIVYRPAVITFGWSRRLKTIGTGDSDGAEAEAPKDSEEAFIALILEAVESWDLEYEPGQAVPLTQDALMDVPTQVLGPVLRGLNNAGQPGEEQAGQTPAPSADFSSSELT